MTIGDDLLLLAINPRDGRVQAAEYLGTALRGAEALDLSLAGRVSVADGRIAIANPRPIGHPLADRALATLHAEGGAPRLDLWLTERPTEPDALNQYVTLLADRGVIRTERRGDGGRTRTRLVPVDLERCAYVRTRIENVSSVGDRALGTIVHSCGLDEFLYPGLRGRSARRRLSRLADDEQVPPALREAIEAVGAAVAGLVGRRDQPGGGGGARHSQ
ncbi:GPP34 family phosphoprotein [Catenulispora sp. NL8]|uniref:GPP34 family phosphoprotein n=1 Tax=Catenulispora pinistramenti TaxID=2705254 RepID=A0ABS5KMA1_9ACTN|nr:GPP34 family phosphoprotein [Catenulispora pinistramenti]MBS2547183.1 GPP34 family phosphoprotein [Catenulispora pinistramenti]